MKKLCMFLTVFLLISAFPASAEGLNVICKDGAAVLTWDAVEGADGYYILRDYNYIDMFTADVTTYTDTDVEVGSGYSYIVAATDAGGSEIWMSDEVSVLITENTGGGGEEGGEEGGGEEDTNLKEYVSVYKNEGEKDTLIAWELPHYDVSKYVTEKTIIGGKSMKWKLRSDKDANELKIELKNITYDISDITETGYAQFYVYPETAMKVLPDINFFMYGGGKDTNIINISSQIKPNQWNTVKVPIANMLKDRLIDPSKINQIGIRSFGNYTSQTYFYIQGLGFWDEIRQPKAKSGSSGADENGNSYAEIVFDKSLDETTFSKDSFTADGLTVSDIKYEDKTVTVYFEELLEPSKSYKINIDGSLADTDGKFTATSYVVFKTPAVFENVAVHSINFNKQTLGNGELVCTAEAAAIYSEKGVPQDITMITAVLKGDQIIALGCDTKTAVELKTKESFSVKLNLENIPDGCRAEVYFTDNAENGKPLCGVCKYFE